MLNLSAAARLELHKVASTGAWLILLEIQVPGLETLYVVRNTENITWNGITWQAFPFELGEYTEDAGGEVPQLSLKVSNINRMIQGYLEQADGGVDSEAILRVVHSDHLDLTTPEIEETFKVNSTTCDAKWVEFILQGDLLLNKRVPDRKYLKDWCPYQFKGIECGYKGSATKCDHTLKSCKALRNTLRFGGEPAIPGTGIYLSNEVK